MLLESVLDNNIVLQIQVQFGECQSNLSDKHSNKRKLRRNNDHFQYCNKVKPCVEQRKQLALGFKMLYSNLCPLLIVSHLEEFKE